VVPGALGAELEGASRSGHFAAVLTVVAKLFGIAQPDVALFGQKDAQQVHLVSRMVADLDLPLRIETVPTVRESDGLALSSRNRLLDSADRGRALSLSRGLRAAREALDATGSGVVLTARTEGFIVGRPDLRETLWRLSEYAAAGADCLFAPGLRTLDDITAVVKEVAPRPVNVLVGSPFTTVSALADAGVRRISVGGALARAAWTGFLAAAREIAADGTFTALGRALPHADVNRLFGSAE
jgi:hypothetical protein